MFTVKFPLTLKFCMLLIVFLLMVNCGGSVIEVWVINQSQDNININNVKHLAQGDSYLVGLVSKGRPGGSFSIFRTQGGCLAKVVYVGKMWPDPEKGEHSFKDEIIITEPGLRNSFSAEPLLDVITVGVYPCD